MKLPLDNDDDELDDSPPNVLDNVSHIHSIDNSEVHASVVPLIETKIVPPVESPVSATHRTGSLLPWYSLLMLDNDP